ncbi:hypothetical protein DVH05_004581 [Phytophthora capsici]|nr:hypothetical protein DVH05_004581 [Phytophthora capsici]
MSTLSDSKVEGITEFSNSKESYRYEISLKSGQVNIWVEDRSSKKQWQTGFLAKENYVTSANVFVDAAAVDYVSCFEQCLNSPIGEDVGRKLLFLIGGKLKLELSLKIRLLRSTRSINYVFELKPIEVEPIDILASKLKDQEEKLERLSGIIDSGTTVFLYVESEGVIGLMLQWKEMIAETFTLNEDKTSIKILKYKAMESERASFFPKGITEFPSNSVTYRYVISLKRNQVNIWLEDRSSKKQWETGLLSKEDYVTTANVFVDAPASDYVLCFQQCLDSPIGEDEGVKRTLVLQNGGNLKIQLSLKTHLLHFTRNIDYTFELKPIAVERIDILESKLKDVQEELGRLRGKIGSGTTVLFYVESEAYLGSKLQWKEVPGTNFTLSEDKTSIKILRSGVNFAADE